MRNTIQSQNSKGRNNLCNLSTDGRILNWILKKEGSRAQTVLHLLKIGLSDGLLWTCLWTSRHHMGRNLTSRVSDSLTMTLFYGQS